MTTIYTWQIKWVTKVNKEIRGILNPPTIRTIERTNYSDGGPYKNEEGAMRTMLKVRTALLERGASIEYARVRPHKAKRSQPVMEDLLKESLT